MSGIRVNRNSVYIPMIQSRFSGFKVNSTYPSQLNRVILQEEYQESISRINNACSLRGDLKYWSIILIVITIVGVVSITVGFSTGSKTTEVYPRILILIGIFLAICECAAVLCICGKRRLQRLKQIQEAVTEESARYSSRIPIPCRWRLITLVSSPGRNGNQQRKLLGYFLVIDIDRSAMVQAGPYYINQTIDESTSLFGRQYADSPPPYPGPPIGSCSQCSTLRPDLSARYCSSCGHAFNSN